MCTVPLRFKNFSGKRKIFAKFHWAFRPFLDLSPQLPLSFKFQRDRPLQQREFGRLQQTLNVIVLIPSFLRLLISCKIKANWMISLVVNKQFKICHLCFLIMNNALQPLETKQQCISQSSTFSKRGIRSRHQNSHSVLSGNRIHLCKVITIHGKSFISKRCVVNSQNSSWGSIFLAE